MITETLAANVVGAWGDKGARWLADLPDLLRQTAGDWGLTVGEPFDLSYHYVTAVTCADGTPAVLKLGVPGGGSLENEGPALAAFGGRGAVRLLRSDLDRAALLLERVLPGQRLRDLVPERDAEATSLIAGVMRRIHVPPPPDCPLPDLPTQATAMDEYVASYGDAGPISGDLVRRAAALMRDLCASAERRVVLHGDLHHDNILRSDNILRDGVGESWLAIDPHGVVGDPGYEVGSMLYNPDPDDRDEDLTALVPSRVEQLADELAMPVERVVAWGFVKAVLSDVWSTEAWSPQANWLPESRALDVARLLVPRL